MATFTNQATLTYSGNVIDSNVVRGELVEVLSATKTAIQNSYSPGGTVTYVINILNAGTTVFNGLTITDDLGGYPFSGTTKYPLEYVSGSVHYYKNGEIQSAPTVAEGPPLTISGIQVPAGGNATVIYEASVTEYAPPGLEESVTNTATVSGDGLGTPLTAMETVGSASSPALTISKSICPATVTENGQLTYTFVIQNTGNLAVTASDLASVSDVFNPILESITATFNGASWTNPDNYTYSAETGIFETVAGQITVPAASYTQNDETGTWETTPGVSTLTVTGTV